MLAADILVAGVGNILLGDDGFGCEVVRELRSVPLPSGVRVEDFGIHGFDLAYALSGCAGAIVIDLVRRNQAPGTLYVIEPQQQDFGQLNAPGVYLDNHSMTLDRVLMWLQSHGSLPGVLRVVGCEPLNVDPDSLVAGLSDPVAANVHNAVVTVQELVNEMIGAKPTDA